jgi:sentrin-specific protease 1
VDCGVFALQFADHAARNADMCFSEADMPLLRLKVAAEIANARLS